MIGIMFVVVAINTIPMTEYQINKLLKVKENIIKKVERKEIKVKTGADILGMTRQGLLKLRKKYHKCGAESLKGLKRGPKGYNRPHNRTPKEVD